MQTLIVQRYEMEKNAILQLQASIETLEASIYAAEQELLNYSRNMDQQIAKLRGGGAELFGTVQGQTIDAWNTYQSMADDDPNKLNQLNTVTDLLWQAYNAQTAMIQESYQARSNEVQVEIGLIQDEISAAQARAQLLQEERSKVQEVYNERIEGLRQELELARQWEQLGESLGSQILAIKTGQSNPEDVFDRMGILREEIGRVQGLYNTAAGEEKIGYAQELSGLYGQLLQMGQEAWQRPSPEYKTLYEEVETAFADVRPTLKANSA